MDSRIPRIRGFGSLALIAGLTGSVIPTGLPAGGDAARAFDESALPARGSAGMAIPGTGDLFDVAVAGCVRGPDPFLIELVPTANANGAIGSVTLHFADSPFGIAVTADGNHLYDASVRTEGLPRSGGANVLWAATPSLDQVQRVGIVRDDGTLEGTVAFNKFLVFITAEASPDVERWSGPILMRGLSASGRMHTMAGHGPFANESCPMWSLGGRDIRDPD